MTPSEFRKSLKQSKVYLHFEDGRSFKGYINRKKDDPEIEGGLWGEAAFTTGMSGYQETMSDPSFLGQHIIFSTAHVGNYEYDKRVDQSEKSHATALIARNFSPNEFLLKTERPLVSGMDTRSLVKYLVNSKKSHKSVLSFNHKTPSVKEFTEAKLICNELSLVSQNEPKLEIAGDNPIVLINYGVKDAIVKNLMAMKLPLVTLPYNATAEQVASYKPSMIFLSNGPGDPREYKVQIEEVKKFFKLNIPMRGICLGHQLISLALGAEVIKLPFGQRGINHPVLDRITGEILITSQNHGYATDEESLLKIAKSNPIDREIFIHHKSLFDKSVEGIGSTDNFLRSVQFHPEANPGPSDAAIFFKEVEEFLKGKNEPVNTDSLHPLIDVSQPIKKEMKYKRVLLVGSGPIKIGQASEFDYSGTQACKSMKALGIEVVLLNSNPATIMTDPDMAYKTYIEPINKETIKKIIEIENVDAVLSTMGGQTALNICVELEEENYLSDHNVALLGAKVDTINKTEDRDLFAKELKTLGYETGKRFKGKSEEDALMMATSKVGYPLIIRRDFALGGKGAALVHNSEELKDVFTSDLKFPITMEKSLLGWKEVELEVMVDCEKSGVIICSIENIDPCGIHTGDSITVAPAQTISDRCYQKLRTMSLTIAKHMGVVAGGANVQFAINPNDEDDIVVIEMNPRVSRSSALASKATGYPIAKISAQLALGFTLKEILNDITQASPVAFEPSLDYVAVKIPIFPFNKFPTSSRKLGPQMRSVGEVLALGGCFNEAFLKALRSLELGLEIPELAQLKTTPFDVTMSYLRERLLDQQELCLLTVMEAMRQGMSQTDIHEHSKITPWFLDQVGELIEVEQDLKKSPELLYENFSFYKSLGFSDKHLAFLTNKAQKDILTYRHENNIFPVFKAVDTCSGEFNAETPYFYSTYAEENEAVSLGANGRAVAIMGSGPNRIGQGIEFDYSCVKSCRHLKTKGIKSIMINSNPETVSTDYDSSDRLYLSALYSEDLFDIARNEKVEGMITSFSGQTGIKIRNHLEKNFRKEFLDINFLGATLEVLDLTEDRKLFSEVTKKCGLAQTTAKEVKGFKQLRNAMIEIGLPVIIRPSYVIGGESMYIFHSFDDLEALPAQLKEQLKSSSTIFQVETYLEGALEYDVDLIRDKNGNHVFTVCEHIEHAGVHSGDSGMITPPVVLTDKLYKKMKEISVQLANHLDILGPINIQYAVKDGEIYCIEANPRGSRTIPFLSKAYAMDLAGIATDAMLGESIKSWDRELAPFFCVKQSTFPFDRFLDDNIILGPKMRSTGETLGIDYDKEMAILKSYLGNYPNLNRVGKVLISLADNRKDFILPYLKQLHQNGYTFLATSGTCSYVRKQGLPCTKVAKIGEDDGLSLLDALKDEDMVMVFNTPENMGDSKSDGEVIRNTAISYGVPTFTREENIKAVTEALLGTFSQDLIPVSVQEIQQ
ncbi:MAG: carbamoyl-phosphate synthase large subunit [Bacteriovoracaceae bacterium]